MMRVGEMKAWQLYVGQSLFLVLIGLFFFFLKSILSSIGVKNEYVDKSIGAVESIATGSVTSSSGVDVVTGILP